MTTYQPPKRATEYIFYVALEDQANAGLFKAAPTLAAGDAKVSTDGSGFTNLDTIPVVTPAAGIAVKVTLSVAEMTGENVFVQFIDAAGDEWYDLAINIQTVTTNQFDDLATPTGVWSSTTRTLTQSAASVTAAVSGTTITVYRGTTWSIAITALGDISAYDIVYFSVKEKYSDSDNNAVLRVKDDASGLLRWQKAAVTTATNGYITIDNAVTGAITITVLEAETDDAEVRQGYYYDIKGIDNDGQVDLISVGGIFNVSADVTRAIT